MKVGRKKLLAAAGFIAVAAVAIVAWLLWETDGLLAVTLATLLLTSLGLGWLVVQSQRQVRVLLAQTRPAAADPIARPDRSGEQAEQLLRAVHAGFARSEHVLDTMIAEWEKVREELRSSGGETLSPEVADGNSES